MKFVVLLIVAGLTSLPGYSQVRAGYDDWAGTYEVVECVDCPTIVTEDGERLADLYRFTLSDSFAVDKTKTTCINPPTWNAGYSYSYRNSEETKSMSTYSWLRSCLVDKERIDYNEDSYSHHSEYWTSGHTITVEKLEDQLFKIKFLKFTDSPNGDEPSEFGFEIIAKLAKK